MKAAETQKWLDDTVGAEIEKGLYALLEKCKAASSDAMRFGAEISKAFGSASEWESFDWKSRYRDMKATFTVKVHAVDKYSAEGML